MNSRALLAVLSVLACASAVVSACNEDGTVVLPASDAGADGTVALDSGGGDGAEDAMEAGCMGVDAASLDAAQVALGRQLVMVHKCVTCHGQALTGNPNGVPSPQTEGGTAYPPNLTPDPMTGLGCWSSDQIVNAILNGVDDQGGRLCPPMPVFGSLGGDAGLDTAGAQAIVAFLQSLTPTSMNVPDTPSCTISDGGPTPEAGPSPDAGNDAAPEASGGDSGGSDAADAGTTGDASGDATSD